MGKHKIEEYRKRIRDLKEVYEEKKHAYQEALLEFNNKRNDAIHAKDPRQVTDWTLNAGVYREKVNAAMNTWVAEGHKNEVESMMAYISQATEKGGQD